MPSTGSSSTAAAQGARRWRERPIGAIDVPRGLQIRDDLDVPVLVFETETDLGPLLDYGPARQPDTDRIRTWEVAGTAHADAYVVGGFAHVLGCDFKVNEGPQHFVAKAALVALNRWMTDGAVPPTAPPLRAVERRPPRSWPGITSATPSAGFGHPTSTSRWRHSVVKPPRCEPPVLALRVDGAVRAERPRRPVRRQEQLPRGVHRQLGRHHRVGVPARVRPGHAVGPCPGRRVPVVRGQGPYAALGSPRPVVMSRRRLLLT